MSSTSSCPNCNSPFPAGLTECPNCATQAFSASRTSGLPQISGYEILGRVGEGGMGAIYLAEEKSLGRRVAIKVVSGKLATEAQAHARFVREARALATIEHANVVRIYSFGDVEGQPYLAMEYIDGETLADRIRRLGRLPIEEAARFTRQILLALDAAWEKGIIHRDIKPSNVLIDRRGQVHVADFGLAKPMQVPGDLMLTQDGYVLGTPYYVSPEQAQGKPTDFRSDIYSCGILLYEMLAGERPFEGTTPFTVVAKHLNEPLPSIRAKRSDVPNRVARLLEWMTQKLPEQRPKSYAELIERFDAILGITPSRPIASTETFSTIPIATPGGYRTPLIISAVVILAMFGWQWYRVRKVVHEAGAAPTEKRLVVAVTPFYGPDDDSAKEGRVMAALVERSITARLGADNVKVIGIDETKQPVRSHDAARQLGEHVGASVVVWGEAFALKKETEIQPYFTLMHRTSQPAVKSESTPENVRSVDVKAADPVAKLSEQSTSVMRVQAEAPNQIELRKTSADGVGEMVSFLAGLHALYDENNPRKALQFFAQAPKTAETMRHRAQAYVQLANPANRANVAWERPTTTSSEEEAIKALEGALALEPRHVQSRAQLADLYLVHGRFKEAAREYERVASSGEPYTTNYAIARDGLLYVREIFRDPRDNDERHDTGSLLAVSPQSESVLGRWTMPGSIRSFEPQPDGFVVRYAADGKESQIETLNFRNGRFDRLPPPGGNLLLRMRRMKVAWVLPINFTEDLEGLIEKRPAHPRLRLRRKPYPNLPQTLPQLEEELRAAARRDPTQPWHPFWLGQALLAEGKKDAATTVWNALLSKDYPGVLYMNFNWMARFFEHLGQRDWADRAYDKALRERKRIPQPIGVTTLIERLINVQFTRMPPEQLKDPERAYLWLQRARTISGPTEADNYAAAAWAGHFRRKGDLARARLEEENARRLTLHPFNMITRSTFLDYAFYAFFATWIGFAGSALMLLFRANRSRPASPDDLRSWRSVWDSLRTLVPKRWVPFALGFGIAGLLIIAFGAYIETSWALPVVLAVTVISVGFVIHTRGRVRAKTAISYLPVQHRLVVAVIYVLFAAAALLLFVQFGRLNSLEAMPIGIADSLGHPVLVADFETRLAKSHSHDLEYVTAVANMLGGNRERAKALFGEMGSDPRARRALAALESGRSEIPMASADELYRAYTAGSLALIPGQGPVGFQWAPVNIVALGTAAIGALLLLAFLFIRPLETAPLSAPATQPRRLLAKAGFLLVPGSFDLRRRSPLRGAIMLTLLGFSLFFGAVLIKAFPVLRSPGPWTAIALPNILSSSPYPPDWSRLDLMFAPPYARLFWPVALLAVVSLCVLHAIRIPSIVALYREEPTREPVTLVSAEEPA